MTNQLIEKPRRYLITIGSPTCKGYELAELTKVTSDVQRVASLFTSPEQGYEHVLANSIPLGASSGTIKTELENWFASPDRKASDCIILYYSGHGDYTDSKAHYLLTSDSMRRKPHTTAIRSDDLVSIFYEGEGERAQNILLLLDTCYSGGGTSQALVEQVKKHPTVKPGGSGLWLVASADSLTEAQDGKFVDALQAVLADEAWIPTGGMEYLTPYDLCMAINDWSQRKQLAQRAWHSTGGSSDRAIFIRNPRYTRRFDGLELRNREHWDVSARGVEGLASPGWFFTGRKNVLQELVAWLETKTSDLQAHVVTGQPGSGKSAVLGRLITAANSRTREELEKSGRVEKFQDTLPEVGSIDAVIHARGVTLEGAASILASQLDIDDLTVTGVLEYLRHRSSPARIVVDALDEAADPIMLERELLAKIAVSPNARLIVGTRKKEDAVVPLAGMSKVIDLDAPAYFSADDIAEYVTSRLVRREPPTAYADPQQLLDAQRVGQEVARKADHSFLYARLVSRGIGQADAIDTSQADWESQLQLPADLSHAFGADLDRFSSETKKRFVDLLLPLAYSRGKGLPQKDIWHSLAAKIAGKPYDNTDIRELMEVAGYYIVRDTEDRDSNQGEVVYRLFHQSFADYLKERTRNENIDGVITDTLVDLITLPGQQQPDWEQVQEPYVLHHLPAHAAKGRRLEKLVADAKFLLAMPAQSLLPEFPTLTSLRSRKIAQSYRQVSHWMRSPNKSVKAPYLLLSALQNGADDLARGLQKIDVVSAWQPQWAQWQSSVSSQVVAPSKPDISCFTVGRNELGDPVAVVGSGGAISVWNLSTGSEIAHSDEFIGSVCRLAIADVDSQKVIASGWHDSSLRVFEMASCQLLKEKTEAHLKKEERLEGISALCVTISDEKTVVATAGSDLTLRMWSLPSLQLLQENSQPHLTRIDHLAAASLEGKALLISGCDSYHHNNGRIEGVLVRVWNVEDLSLKMEIPHGLRDLTQHLEVLTLDEKEVLLVQYYPEYNVELWDLKSEKRMGGTEGKFAEVICAVKWRGETVVLGNGFPYLRQLKVEPLIDEEGKSSYLMRPKNQVSRVDGKQWSHPVEIHGRSSVVSNCKEHLRIWDLAELIEGNGDAIESPLDPSLTPEDVDDPLIAVAADSLYSHTIATGSARGKINVYHAHDGRLKWSANAPKGASALDIIVLDDRPLLVAGGSGKWLQIYDLETGELVREPIQVSASGFLATCVMDGDPVCFLTNNLKEGLDDFGEAHYGIRAWNLRTATEIEIPEKGFGKPDFAARKFFKCLSTAIIDGDVMILAASETAVINAWNGRTREEIRSFRTQSGHNEYTSALTTGRTGNRNVAVGGDDKGVISIWDLSSRADQKPLKEVAQAHRFGVGAVALPDWGPQCAVISGDNKGVVKIWSSSLDEICSIELKERVIGIKPLAEKCVAIATVRGLVVLKLNAP